MIRLLEMIARREGFGDRLAEGSARLAQQWGTEDKPCHLTVKRQEVSMHDPRVKVGVGIGFAVSHYGADHMTAAHDTVFVNENSFSLNSVKPLAGRSEITSCWRTSGAPWMPWACVYLVTRPGG
jgi:aldehyde:ferredoxin oxidoreductase